MVEPIGIPPEAELVVGPGDFAYLNLARRPDAKKGDHGRVLVVGARWSTPARRSMWPSPP